jgi:hypothetical protein
MQLAARSTIIAGALATAAVASPMASARPNVETTTAAGQTQTTAIAPVIRPSGLPETTASAPAVRPNPDQHVTHVSRVGPPILRAATASQQSEVHRAQTAASHALAYAPPALARYSPAGLNTNLRSPAKGPRAVHVSTHDTPFDWGAAAIGAVGGVVVSLLVGGLVVTQRRQTKPNRAKALA